MTGAGGFTGAASIPAVERPMGMLLPVNVHKKKKAKVPAMPEHSAAKSVLKLLEMAMDLGDTPDVFDPTLKRNLATGHHPLGQNPAFAPGSHEKLASGTYKNLIAQIQAHGGVVPRNRQGVGKAMGDMYATLDDLQQREAAHREELEQLAVEAVLRLPEFKSLRQAVQDGRVRIEPHLNRRIEIQNAPMSHEPREEIPGTNVPEIKQDYEELIARRKVANAFSHGAAVANNYAYTTVFNELHDIDPGLTQDYGKVMAYSELGYFVQSPEDMRRLAAQASGTEIQGGTSQVKHNPDGSLVIYAVGLTFPMLYHEIVKGCMSFLSGADEEEDRETAQHVQRHSDFIDDEQTMMHVGPELYRQFKAALGPGNEDLMPLVYDELQRLPGSEYNRVLQGLTSGSPEGRAWFRQLVQQLRQEQAQEGQAESLVKRLLGS